VLVAEVFVGLRQQGVGDALAIGFDDVARAWPGATMLAALQIGCLRFVHSSVPCQCFLPVFLASLPCGPGLVSARSRGAAFRCASCDLLRLMTSPVSSV